MERRKRRRAAGRGGDRGPAQGWWLGAREVMPAQPVSPTWGLGAPVGESCSLTQRLRGETLGKSKCGSTVKLTESGQDCRVPGTAVSLPETWQGLLSEAREKQVWERAPRVCQGGSERGLRRWQRAGRGGCPCRPVRRLVCWFFCLLPAVLWEERNEAG